VQQSYAAKTGNVASAASTYEAQPQQTK